MNRNRKSFAGGGAAWPFIGVILAGLFCLLGAGFYGLFCYFARLAVLK